MATQMGMVHVYTGNGKGKTTAAIGLMVRAVGAGKKVYFGQFMKQGDYSEIAILKERFKEITIAQYGEPGFILGRNATNNEREMAQAGFLLAKQALTSSEYDLVVLDEINVALFLDLVAKQDVLALLEAKPKHVELVLTGRYAHEEVMKKADLVTEMQEIKHYYNQHVPARLGIEM